MEFPIKIIACFDTWVMGIRISSIKKQIAREDYTKAARTLDDCLCQLDGCEVSDIAQPWRDELWNAMNCAQCMLLCGVTGHVFEDMIRDIEDILNKNIWYENPDRWGALMSRRLASGNDTSYGNIGVLSQLPNDILYTIAAKTDL